MDYEALQWVVTSCRPVKCLGCYSSQSIKCSFYSSHLSPPPLRTAKHTNTAEKLVDVRHTQHTIKCLSHLSGRQWVTDLTSISRCMYIYKDLRMPHGMILLSPMLCDVRVDISVCMPSNYTLYTNSILSLQIRTLSEEWKVSPSSGYY